VSIVTRYYRHRSICYYRHLITLNDIVYVSVLFGQNNEPTIHQK